MSISLKTVAAALLLGGSATVARCTNELLD
jgi:hypothetical protein